MKTIITDSIKNTNRILRKKNDKDNATYGTEAITALGIAWQIIMEHLSEKGITNARLINDGTASAIVLKLIFEDKSRLPFVPIESICLSTAKEIYSNVNLLRCNTHKASSVGKDRVECLEKFADLFEDELKKQNLYDGPLALKEAIRLLKNGDVNYPIEEIETCYYAKPSTLEKEFVSLLGESKEISKPEGTEVTYKFVRAYGIVNEADYVAKTIVDEEIQLGDVEILCDTSIYAPFIEETFAKRGLEYTFSTGVSASGFNVIVMIKDLIKWYKSGCIYKELFNVVHNPIYAIEVAGKQMRASGAFLKGISYGIGWGKDRYINVEPNEYDKRHSGAENERDKTFREVELLKLKELADKIDNAKLSVEILDELVSYAREHSFKRNMENRFTIKALDLLRKDLNASSIIFKNKEDTLDYLLNELDALSYSMTEENNKASVSSIYTPLCLNRKYVFCLGLSAKEFKISTADSPVLSDDVRKNIFGYPPVGNVTLAENNIVNAEQIIRDTLKSAPDCSFITILSSSADVMRDASDVSASSLYDKLKTENGANESEEPRYYEITTHPSEIKHKYYWDGFDISYDESDEEKLTFSKSSLDSFLNCPLSYHYEKDLYINQEDYKDYDPSKWLEANTKGNLIHGILEKYANAVLVGNNSVPSVFDINSEEFKKAVADAVKECESECAAPNDAIRGKEAEDCAKVAAAYLDFLHNELNTTGWVVYKCEEVMNPDISKSEFSLNGKKYVLNYTGTIDRIDMKINEDGSKCFRIVDYKTGKKHSSNEMMETTKQHLIYADYVRKCFEGDVDSFDYLFINHIDNSNDWKVSINKDILLNDVIESSEESGTDKDIFDKVFRLHDYATLKDMKRDCTYCKYKDMCLYKIL